MKYKGEQKEKEQGASLKLARKVRVRGGQFPVFYLKEWGLGNFQDIYKNKFKDKNKNIKLRVIGERVYLGHFLDRSWTSYLSEA